MIEVELKVRLAPKLRERLFAVESLSTPVFKSEKTDIDEYFDTAEFDFFKQGVFMRSRNSRKVDLKFDTPAQTQHGDCTEMSFELPLSKHEVSAFNNLCVQKYSQWKYGETFPEAKELNKLQQLALVQKKRVTYGIQGGELCLDEVEGLGAFAEIEFACDTEEAAQEARSRIAQIRELLDVAPLGEGYVELLLKKTHPDVYRLGRYQVG